MNLCQNFSMPKIPFTIINPSQCFGSEDYKNVHQELNLLNTIPGLALCTGEPGTGKTLSVSGWTETLNPNSVDICNGLMRLAGLYLLSLNAQPEL